MKMMGAYVLLRVHMSHRTSTQAVLNIYYVQGFFLAERSGTYLREQNSKNAKIK
jgi:hypothetical protein